MLSCGQPELPDRVTIVVEESKRREKHIDDLEHELAGVVGVQLAEEMAQWRASGGGGEWVKFVSRTDDLPSAQPFLQTIALTFAAHLSGQSDSTGRYTLLLASSPLLNILIFNCRYGFRGQDKHVKAIGEELKRQIETLKGGGKGVRWNGKFVGVWLAEREGKMASSLLSQPLDDSASACSASTT